MKMVRLGGQFTLTMPSQPNSRPWDSPRPYPHLNLLDQLLVTSRGVFRGLSFANLLLLLNQLPLPGVPLLRPHHQRPPRLLLCLPQASGAAAVNRNLVSHSSKPPPPASMRANDNARASLQPQRSTRLNPQAYAIKSSLPALAPQSLSDTMARTYPLSLAFNQCLGSKEDPYSFSSVHLEDLRNGETKYLITVQQLIDAIPKMLDPASRFAL